MFLVNSRLGLFSATLIKFTPSLKIPQQRPHFFRSYVCILPSSLTRVHSSALEYSSRLPVSVYGTVPGSHPLEIISRRLDYTHFASLVAPLALTAHLRRRISLPASTTRCLDPDNHHRAGLHLTRHPFGFYYQRYWNMNQFPIGYAFQPRLRGRLTLGRLTLPRKPQAFGERVFHPSFRYSCLHSHFCHLQDSSQSPFFSSQNAPLPSNTHK